MKREIVKIINCIKFLTLICLPCQPLPNPLGGRFSSCSKISHQWEKLKKWGVLEKKSKDSKTLILESPCSFRLEEIPHRRKLWWESILTQDKLEMRHSKESSSPVVRNSRSELGNSVSLVQYGQFLAKFAVNWSWIWEFAFTGPIWLNLSQKWDLVRNWPILSVGLPETLITAPTFNGPNPIHLVQPGKSCA